MVDTLQLVSLLVATFLCVHCHPQCLDFRAPFEPSSPLGFCSEYASYTCCDSQNDNKLQEEYNYIQSKASSRLWGRCQGFVKQILCQRCSPFAAHIYEAETTGKPRGFPGLCRSFCNEFYDKCRSFLWLLDPQLAGSEVLASRDGFCSRVSLGDTNYCYPDLKTNPVVQGLTVSQTSAGDGCLCLQKVNSNQKLAMPLWAGSPNDDSGRLFVIEQLGRIRIYNTRTKRWNFGCFLDLTLKARVLPIPADERGALGMAFHPNFAENGRFFLFYTAIRWFWEQLPEELRGRPFAFEDKVIISEWRVSKLNPDVADIFSEKILISLPQPFLNHNGGEILFGNDGYLYVFFGDGGGAGDPLASSQDKNLLHGKVIRIDVDSDTSRPYTIPSDNPFVNETGTRPEIYALGMRNPWRCGMDRGERATGANRGRILCGDVGQYAEEEIDLIEPGANYGWNSREGFRCFNQATCGNIGTEVLPIHAYNHSVGLSVTGGVFYRGCESPALDGLYIYGDYISKRLFSLNATGGEWVNSDVSLCGSDLCQGDLQGTNSENIISFGEDEDGEIYMMTTRSSNSFLCDGSIYKIVDPVTRNDPSTCAADLTNSERVPLPKRSIVWEAAQSKPKSRTVVRISRKRKSWRKNKLTHSQASNATHIKRPRNLAKKSRWKRPLRRKGQRQRPSRNGLSKKGTHRNAFTIATSNVNSTLETKATKKTTSRVYRKKWKRKSKVGQKRRKVTKNPNQKKKRKRKNPRRPKVRRHKSKKRTSQERKSRKGKRTGRYRPFRNKADYDRVCGKEKHKESSSQKANFGCCNTCGDSSVVRRKQG